MHKIKPEEIDKIISKNLRTMDKTLHQAKYLFSNLEAQSKYLQYLLLVKEELKKPDGKVI